MDVSLIGQGRRLEVDTISNNVGSQQNVQISNKDNYIPVVKKPSISKEMEHGQKEKEITEGEVKKAVDKINKFLQGEVTHVEYERHDVLKNEFIIRIINNETKEVIKEIPPKKILDMVAELYKLAGVIVDKKA
jgi:flagellar protein FlaG